MKYLHLAIAAGALCIASNAFAAYPDVSSEDQPQYSACKTYSLQKYQGGDTASPIAGQTKAEAFCTCMWNETAEDFKGGLAKFSETPKGAATNKICEKYANWES